MLYLATKDELAPIHPAWKFATIKGVVFFSFWQSVGIAILVKIGVIRSNERWATYDAEDVGARSGSCLPLCVVRPRNLNHGHSF